MNLEDNSRESEKALYKTQSMSFNRPSYSGKSPSMKLTQGTLGFSNDGESKLSKVGSRNSSINNTNSS